MNWRINYWIIIILIYAWACKKNTKIDTPVSVSEDQDIRAWDLSFQPFLIKNGVKFKDSNGSFIHVLEFAKQQGINYIRLRLWNNPSDEHSSAAEVKLIAKQIHDLGLHVWLDFHLSDRWADPGNQEKPAAWATIADSVLPDSVASFVTNTLNYLKLQSKDLVQIGNETNSGFLWPTANTNITQGQKMYCQCLKAGFNAIKRYNSSISTMVHVAGFTIAQNQINLLDSNKVKYDFLGLSYYPNWHGNSIKASLAAMATIANKNNTPIIIAETAFPFTDSFADWTNNLIWHKQVGTDFEISATGQKQFMQHLYQWLNAEPLVCGLCYWAPDYVAFDGNQSKKGSPWENVALWDFNLNALPAAYAWKK